MRNTSSFQEYKRMLDQSENLKEAISLVEQNQNDLTKVNKFSLWIIPYKDAVILSIMLQVIIGLGAAIVSVFGIEADAPEIDIERKLNWVSLVLDIVMTITYTLWMINYGIPIFGLFWATIGATIGPLVVFIVLRYILYGLECLWVFLLEKKHKNRELQIAEKLDELAHSISEELDFPERFCYPFDLMYLLRLMKKPEIESLRDAVISLYNIMESSVAGISEFDEKLLPPDWNGLDTYEFDIKEFIFQIHSGRREKFFHGDYEIKKEQVLEQLKVAESKLWEMEELLDEQDAVEKKHVGKMCKLYHDYREYDKELVLGRLSDDKIKHKKSTQHIMAEIFIDASLIGLWISVYKLKWPIVYPLLMKLSIFPRIIVTLVIFLVSYGIIMAKVYTKIDNRIISLFGEVDSELLEVRKRIDRKAEEIHNLLPWLVVDFCNVYAINEITTIMEQCRADTLGEAMATLDYCLECSNMEASCSKYINRFGNLILYKE